MNRQRPTERRVLCKSLHEWPPLRSASQRGLASLHKHAGFSEHMLHAEMLFWQQCSMLRPSECPLHRTASSTHTASSETSLLMLAPTLHDFLTKSAEQLEPSILPVLRELPYVKHEAVGVGLRKYQLSLPALAGDGRRNRQTDLLRSLFLELLLAPKLADVLGGRPLLLPPGRLLPRCRRLPVRCLSEIHRQASGYGIR